MRKLLVASLLALLFMFTLSSVGNLAAADAVDTTFTNALVPDTPIDITSNADFEFLGFPGNGTVDAPYIIDGKSFDIPVGYWLAGVKVQFTTAHFIVQNCDFRGANKTEEPTYADFGVYMKNVSNAIVKDCVFSELMYGVFLAHCADITIEQNNFTGMDIEWAEYDYMGRGVGTGTIDVVNERIVVRNNYMENCSNGILFMEVHDFEAYDNVIVNSGTGIHIEHEIDNGIIRQNTILNGTVAGIQCTRSNNVEILDNTCMYFGLYGIWLDEDGVDNFVYQNVLKHNGDFSGETGSGIFVQNLSTGNNITMNDLISNFVNVVNDNVGNYYDLNYYSDYEGTDDDADGIGEDPYLITGTTNTSDLHPRVLTISDYLDLINSAPATSTIPTTNTTSNTTTTTTPEGGLPLDQIILISGSIGIVVIVIFVIVLKRNP